MGGVVASAIVAGQVVAGAAMGGFALVVIGAVLRVVRADAASGLTAASDHSVATSTQ